MKKEDVIAIFNMAHTCLEVRELLEYEKRVTREAFYKLPFEDFTTKSYITVQYEKVFNIVMS